MKLVHAQPWEIRKRLAELDLQLAPLQKAAQIALRERGLCTENDPPFIPGTEAWRWLVRTMREDLPLQEDGNWRRANLGNYALVVNDKFKLNIAFATGDEATGRNGVSPRTKSLKGLYTQAAIARNALEDDLFPDTFPEEFLEKARALGGPTWIYLLYTSATEVRAELSLPDKQEGGDITSWKERIIVPDLDGESNPDDNGNGPDFDIDVQLKL